MGKGNLPITEHEKVKKIWVKSLAVSRNLLIFALKKQQLTNRRFRI